jgi:hypothetical protein
LAEQAPNAMEPGQPIWGSMMPPPPEKRYDCKIKRCIKTGKMLIDILPPEDFLIDASATRIDEDEVRFIGDKTRVKRSALKLRHPDKVDLIDDLPAYAVGVDSGQEKLLRENDSWGLRNTVTDKGSELIEVWEMYVNLDYDGDGVSEWWQFVVAGTFAEQNILSEEPWGGLLPYTDLVPNPQPHRWRGRSLFEDLYDVQRVKTVLMRQTLDNLYLANNPKQVANEQMIENKDAVTDQSLGLTVWTKGDPNSAVVPLVVPFVAKDSFAVLEYMDMVASKRTGVSRETMGLDPDTLQNQTATAVNAQQTAAHTKVEAFARNIAECGGLKRLFKCLLRLFVENQRQARTLRLRNQWVQIDPRGWDADMDCTINVGLGAGSRDKDLAMLQGVAMKQEMGIQAMGDPFNPILNVGHVLNTYRKMAEASQLKNVDQYFPEITQEQVAQIAQQRAQNPPPNPEAMKAQAQMQIEQMKIQANQQMEQMKAQIQAEMNQQQIAAEQQRDAQKAQADMMAMRGKAEIEGVQAQADIASNNKKIEADIILAEKKFQLERELAILNAQLEMKLKQQDAAIKLTQALQKPKTGAEGEGGEGQDDTAQIQAVIKDLLNPADSFRQSSDAVTAQMQAVMQQMQQMQLTMLEMSKPKKRVAVRDASGRIVEAHEVPMQ